MTCLNRMKKIRRITLYTITVLKIFHRIDSYHHCYKIKNTSDYCSDKSEEFD